jgi:hypothetical protein
MGKLTGFLAIIATAITAQIAVAQTPQKWPCPQCRAVYEFKTCETVSEADVPAHQAVLVGEVVGTSTLSCSTALTVTLRGSSIPGLPASVDIDLGPCHYWSGKIGDIITALVSKTPQPDTGRYALNICPLRTSGHG